VQGLDPFAGGVHPNVVNRTVALETSRVACVIELGGKFLGCPELAAVRPFWQARI
jgi:hypothetical protein